MVVSNIFFSPLFGSSSYSFCEIWISCLLLLCLKLLWWPRLKSPESLKRLLLANPRLVIVTGVAMKRRIYFACTALVLCAPPALHTWFWRWFLRPMRHAQLSFCGVRRFQKSPTIMVGASYCYSSTLALVWFWSGYWRTWRLASMWRFHRRYVRLRTIRMKPLLMRRWPGSLLMLLDMVPLRFARPQMVREICFRPGKAFSKFEIGMLIWNLKPGIWKSACVLQTNMPSVNGRTMATRVMYLGLLDHGSAETLRKVIVNLETVCRYQHSFYGATKRPRFSFLGLLIFLCLGVSKGTHVNGFDAISAELGQRWKWRAGMLILWLMDPWYFLRTRNWFGGWRLEVTRITWWQSANSRGLRVCCFEVSWCSIPRVPEVGFDLTNWRRFRHAQRIQRTPSWPLECRERFA